MDSLLRISFPSVTALGAAGKPADSPWPMKQHPHAPNVGLHGRRSPRAQAVTKGSAINVQVPDLMLQRRALAGIIAAAIQLLLSDNGAAVFVGDHHAVIVHTKDRMTSAESASGSTRSM